MDNSILFIRTHKTISGGGPVPPLGILYLTSSIIRSFKDKYRIKIIDTGLLEEDISSVRSEIEEFKPSIVGFSTLSCESSLMHKLADITKTINRDTVVLVGGPHATLLKDRLLTDKNIDIGVIGEADDTIIDILRAFLDEKPLEDVNGIAYRKGANTFLTAPRQKLEEIDEYTIIPEVFDKIPIDEYSRYKNWSGARKRKRYIPILSSRGCPYGCTFCTSRNIFGQSFRARSPQNVFNEILELSEQCSTNEIHFFDDIFNYDKERAKAICSLLINSGRRWHIAFPNGLRTDKIDDDLMDHLKKAGTYKIHYGIETVTPRLQQTIGKYLDMDRVEEVIGRTVSRGIIASGYFILGFPGETQKEMLDTVDFAVNSSLDNAFFFKFTDFSRTCRNIEEEKELHFYPANRIDSTEPEKQLNIIILQAQQRFYLSIRRILRGFFRAPRKTEFLSNLLKSLAIILQSVILRNLDSDKSSKNITGA